MQHIFSLAMIALSILGSCSYMVGGDWPRAVYWATAAVLTGTVTFWVH